MSVNYIKSGTAIGDTIDDETVILNLTNGVYYSCRELSSRIWVLLEKGISSDTLFNIVDNDAHKKHQLDLFLGELIEEELLVVTDRVYENSGNLQTVIREGEEFELKIEKYTDMKDLLELDPVHEVYHHSKKNRI